MCPTTAGVVHVVRAGGAIVRVVRGGQREGLGTVVQIGHGTAQTVRDRPADRLGPVEGCVHVVAVATLRGGFLHTRPRKLCGPPLAADLPGSGHGLREEGGGQLAITVRTCQPCAGAVVSFDRAGQFRVDAPETRQIGRDRRHGQLPFPAEVFHLAA